MPRRSSSRVRRKRKRRICRRDNYVCKYCGADLLSNFEMYMRRTVDHVVPISHDGAQSDVENMACCCHLCNLLKGDYNPGNVDDAKIYIEEQRKVFYDAYKKEKKLYRKPWYKRLFGFIWSLIW